MNGLNFKNITYDNWLERDDALDSLVKPYLDGTYIPLFGKDYLEYIYRPSLGDNVPSELHELFEVVRGSMSYGYFFYPLFTLAAEQLFRVAERAVGLKCEAVGVPKSISTLAKKIEYLFEQNILCEKDIDRWKSIRMLRNRASHPTQQNILPPAVAIPMIESIAELISNLYSDV